MALKIKDKRESSGMKAVNDKEREREREAQSYDGNLSCEGCHVSLSSSCNNPVPTSLS
jgi:hypothetical protein